MVKKSLESKGRADRILLIEANVTSGNIFKEMTLWCMSLNENPFSEILTSVKRIDVRISSVSYFESFRVRVGFHWLYISFIIRSEGRTSGSRPMDFREFDISV